MGTSFTGEISNNRLTSFTKAVESHLYAKCQRNQRLTQTLLALDMAQKEKKKKKDKKHSVNADTSMSVTLMCDIDLTSRSLDVAYCIVPWYQV